MEDIKKTLSIRNKIIYIVLFSSVFFMVVLYIFSFTFLLRSFRFLENDQVVRNLKRVELSIENTINNQSTKLKDWAYWDDTYEFINNKNKAYIESNLTNESLVSLQVNAMIFINNNDEIVYSKFIDINTGEDLPQSEILDYMKSNIDSIKKIGNENKINNFIKIKDKGILISVDHIIKSDQTGDPRGILIFGSFVSDEMVSSMNKMVGSSVDLYSYNSFIDLNDVAVAKNNLSQSSTHFVYPLSTNLVYGYSLINDIYKKPIYIVRVEIPRDIYKQGKNTIYLFLIILIVSMFLLGILILVLLEKIVIKRLIKLKDKVAEISISDDFSKSVDESNDDEIGSLAIIINKMFQKIKKGNDQEKNFNQTEKLSSEKIKAHMEELEKLNKLMIGRELKIIDLKNENAKLKENKI